jgi:hypothetical protein
MEQIGTDLRIHKLPSELDGLKSLENSRNEEAVVVHRFSGDLLQKQLRRCQNGAGRSVPVKALQSKHPRGKKLE